MSHSMAVNKGSGLFIKTRSAAGAVSAFQGELFGGVAGPFFVAEGGAADDAFSEGGQLGVGLGFVNQGPPVPWQRWILERCQPFRGGLFLLPGPGGAVLPLLCAFHQIRPQRVAFHVTHDGQ